MKVYAQAKSWTKKERATGKVVYGLGMHRVMMMCQWLEKGYITKLTFDYNEWLAIRNELKAKGLL
jgi:hypothetical protein